MNINRTHYAVESKETNLKSNYIYLHGNIYKPTTQNYSKRLKAILITSYRSNTLQPILFDFIS